MGEEEGGEVGAASAQERELAIIIDADEAGDDDDGGAGQGAADGIGVDGDGVGVNAAPVGAEVDGTGAQDRRATPARCKARVRSEAVVSSPVAKSSSRWRPRPIRLADVLASLGQEAVSGAIEGGDDGDDATVWLEPAWISATAVARSASLRRTEPPNFRTVRTGIRSLPSGSLAQRWCGGLRFRPTPPRPSPRGEGVRCAGDCFGEVGDDLLWVFEADAEADEAVCDSDGATVLWRHIGVGHARGVSDEGFDAADVLDEGAEFDAVQEVDAGLRAAGEFEGNHAAVEHFTFVADVLLRGELCLREVGEAGVVDTRDGRVVGEPLSNDLGVAGLLAEAEGEGFEASRGEPGVEGGLDRAGTLSDPADALEELGIARGDRAAESCRVAFDVLGR